MLRTRILGPRLLQPPTQPSTTGGTSPEDAGYRLLHVRHALLKRLFADEVVFKKNQPDIEIVIAAVERLADLGLIQADLAHDYAKHKRFINQRRFDEILSWLPGPLPGTSLAETNSELLSDWHPTRNLPLTPQLITPGSGRRVWWVCQYGHEWQAPVSNRAKGIGCAKCSKKQASADHNLHATSPELLSYWDYAKNHIHPDEITPRSNSKVWWLCRKGHSFDMSPKHFARKQGCPVCSGKRTNSDNCLAANYPELAKYWDFAKNEELTPNQIPRSSGKRFWWLCDKCGHNWHISPNAATRHSNREYCPRCRTGQE